MKAKKIWGISLGLLLILQTLSAQESPLKDFNRELASRIYQKISLPGKNLFFSPYSIFTALSMTYAGAEGNTRLEMAQALGFPDQPEKLYRLFPEFLSLIKKIQSQKTVEILSANRIWPHFSEPFLKSYLTVLSDFFHGEIIPVNFSYPEKARELINLWVEKETRNRIKNLIPPKLLSALSRMVLVNAVYFKGDWLVAFPEGKTRNDFFYPFSEKEKKTAFMNLESRLNYGEENQIQILELFYQGRDLSMVFLLPKKNTSLKNAENLLFSGEFPLLTSRKVKVVLPRIKLESSFDLSETLAQLGMTEAFDDRADFSGMNGKKNLYIKAILHKAFLEMNEKGTEAAAATAVVMATKSAGIDFEKPILFQANHPFIFAILEKSTGMILFAGKFEKP